MSEFRWYKRKGLIEARPVRSDEDWSMISVANSDRASVEYLNHQGLIARNPENHADQWYIHPTYFAKHYQLEDDSND